MDPFILGFYLIVGIIVIVGIYSIFFEKGHYISHKNRPKEDENMKRLYDLERYKFWRDYADKGRK